MVSHALSSAPFQSGGFISVERFKNVFKEHAEVFILLLIAFVYTSYGYYEKQVIQDVLDAPQKNDFFYIDYVAIDAKSDHRFRYIPMRVMDIDDNGIEFKVGNIAHTTPVSPREHAEFDRTLLLRNYYRVDPLYLTHARIEELRYSGAIYNARRPRNIYIDGWIVMHEHELVVENDL